MRRYKSPEQEAHLRNLRRKKLKPRRKYHCDAKHQQWVGAEVYYEGEYHPLYNLRVTQDGRPNNGLDAKQNARECAAMFRARCPNADIHIRRGIHVVCKAYNEYDSALLWDFSARVNSHKDKVKVPYYQFFQKKK